MLPLSPDFSSSAVDEGQRDGLLRSPLGPQAVAMTGAKCATLTVLRHLPHSSDGTLALGPRPESDPVKQLQTGVSTEDLPGSGQVPGNLGEYREPPLPH